MNAAKGSLLGIEPPAAANAKTPQPVDKPAAAKQ